MFVYKLLFTACKNMCLVQGNNSVRVSLYRSGPVLKNAENIKLNWRAMALSYPDVM